VLVDTDLLVLGTGAKGTAIAMKAPASTADGRWVSASAVNTNLTSLGPVSTTHGFARRTRHARPGGNWRSNKARPMVRFQARLGKLR
jgi:hypothetical protein